MKMGRIVLIAIVIAIIAIASGIWYAVSSVDSIIEATIEKYGAQVTGTTVEVGAVDISIRSGRGEIRDLRIANPEGFSEQDAFTLDLIGIHLDIATLGEQPLVLRWVTIRSPVMHLELDSAGQSNIDAIHRYIESHQGAAAESPSEPVRSSYDRPTRLRIDEFAFENGTVRADLTAVGGQVVTTELPGVRINELGGENGAPLEEIGKEIIAAFGMAATKGVASRGADALIDRHLEGEAGDKARELLQEWTDR